MPSLKLCSPVWARDRAGCGTTLRLVTGDIDVGHPVRVVGKELAAVYLVSDHRSQDR